jgi:beta-carotene hydroxylase
MLLRFSSDRRALVWAFVLFPLAPALAYLEPRALWLATPLAFYLSYCAGVLTHNHAHSPVFRARRWNRLYSLWLSIFYGCPVFVWIPTHLANHHRYLNGEGDVARTTLHSPRNTALAALSYPFRAAQLQWPLIREYVMAARISAGSRFLLLVGETLAVTLGHAALLGLALWLHGPSRGTVVYALSAGLPAALAASWMMLTNYLQHVDCEPESPDNHSRNFVNPWFNWLTFDNGYHTVHHEQPGLHWSLARAAHVRRIRGIAPHLQCDSPLSYWFSEFVLKRGLPTDSDENSRGRPARKLIQFLPSQVSEVAHARRRRGADHR